MSDETQKVLKLELGFDENATAEINRQLAASKVDSVPELVSRALRVHGWFLDNQSKILIRNGEAVERVTLEL